MEYGFAVHGTENAFLVFPVPCRGFAIVVFPSCESAFGLPDVLISCALQHRLGSEYVALVFQGRRGVEEVLGHKP